MDSGKVSQASDGTDGTGQVFDLALGGFALPASETAVSGKPRDVSDFVDSLPGFSLEEAFAEITAELENPQEQPDEFFSGDEEDIPEKARKLSGRQRLTLRLIMTGMKKGEAGAKAGYTNATVSLLLRTPEAQAYLEYLSRRMDSQVDAVQSLFQENSLKAAVRIIDIMNDPKTNRNLAATCAFDILDRAGHKPVQKAAVVVNADAITNDDIKRLAAMDNVVKEMYNGPAQQSGAGALPAEGGQEPPSLGDGLPS